MRCFECNTEMRTKNETIKWECGLPDVYLVDVEVRRCPHCGSHEEVVPNTDGLHDYLVTKLIVDAPLDKDRIRFLRKYLGWSQKDFSTRIGVAVSTISRWESGGQPMNKWAQMILKMHALVGHKIEDYSDDMEEQATACRQRLDEVIGRRMCEFIEQKITADEIAQQEFRLRLREEAWESDVGTQTAA